MNMEGMHTYGDNCYQDKCQLCVKLCAALLIMHLFLWVFLVCGLYLYLYLWVFPFYDACICLLLFPYESMHLHNVFVYFKLYI